MHLIQFVSGSNGNELKMVHVGPMVKNCRALEAVAVLLVPLGNFELNRFVICTEVDVSMRDCKARPVFCRSYVAGSTVARSIRYTPVQAFPASQPLASEPKSTPQDTWIQAYFLLSRIL